MLIYEPDFPGNFVSFVFLHVGCDNIFRWSRDIKGSVKVAVMKRVVKLTLLAAAVLPCSAFFTSPAIARAAPRLGSNSHNRCLISDRPQQHGGVIGLCAAQAALPRRPPPPPPKKAAVGAGGASHLKIKDPQLQAGAWREELGLGKNIASCAVCNRSSHPLL